MKVKIGKDRQVIEVDVPDSCGSCTAIFGEANILENNLLKQGVSLVNASDIMTTCNSRGEADHHINLTAHVAGQAYSTDNSVRNGLGRLSHCGKK